jgi:hypothetical protein
MNGFKEMDPELMSRLLEGQVDVLKPLAVKEDAFFRHAACPKCGASQNEPQLNTRTPFTPGSPLPNKILSCLNCRTKFDPHTGLVLQVSVG